jgi:hypothetical protein
MLLNSINTCEQFRNLPIFLFQIVSKHNNFTTSTCLVAHQQTNKQTTRSLLTSHLSPTSETIRKMQSSFQGTRWYDPVRDTLRVPPRPGQGGMNYQGTSTNIGRYYQEPGSLRQDSRGFSGFEKMLRSQWTDQGTREQRYLCNYCQASFRGPGDRVRHENFEHGINYGR